MHNTVRKKQEIFEQLCHFLNTNSELLPASASVGGNNKSVTIEIDCNMLRKYKDRYRTYKKAFLEH